MRWPKRDTELDGIKQRVAATLGVKVSDIEGRQRTEAVVRARWLCAYLMRMETDATLKSIGQVLGNRSPATICYAFTECASRVKTDPLFKWDYDRVHTGVSQRVTEIQHDNRVRRQRFMKPIQLWGRYIAFWMATIMLGVGSWRIGHNTWSAVGWEHGAIVAGGILTGVMGVMCYFMVGALVEPVVKWCWYKLRHKDSEPFTAMLSFK